MSESQPWVPFPKITTTVNHGKGKSVVSGVVTVTFNGANTVYVDTAAHHNDTAPALTYRDREWLASAHLSRQPDGTWTQSDPSVTYGVSQRGSIGYGKETPPTYRAAIIAALCATVADVWTADLDRQGIHAQAAQRLHTLLPERDKAAAALAETDRQVAALQATLAATGGDRAPGQPVLFTLPLMFAIVPEEWASEYDTTPGEAIQGVSARLSEAAADGSIARLVTEKWPMMRDDATVTVGQPVISKPA